MLNKDADTYLSRLGYKKSLRLEKQRILRSSFVKLLAVALLLLFALLLILLAKNWPAFKYRKNQPFTARVIMSDLKEPQDLTFLAKDQLAVSDAVLKNILIRQENNRYLKNLVSQDQKLSAPRGLFYNQTKKQLLVADWQLGKVFVFSANGRLLSQFPSGADEKLGPPRFTPLAVAGYKDKYYVTSFNGIFVFDQKGVPQGQLQIKSGNIKLNYPAGLAINQKNGHLYVADSLNRRIVALTNSGRIRWVAGGLAGRFEQSFFSLPRDVTIDNKGRLYVADAFNHHVVVLNEAGKLISIIGREGSKAGRLSFPEGVLVDRSGRLYVADRENRRVQEFKIVFWPKPGKLWVDRYNREIKPR